MPRRLRILTLIDFLAPTGGAERLAARVAIGLNPARFERTICATRRVSPYAVDDVRAAGVRVVCLGRRSKASPRPWRRLVRMLREEKVDVLHAHGFGSNAWGTVLGRLAGVPVIIAQEHGWSFEGESLRRFVDRAVIARGADAFLAVSREDRRRMVEIEHIDPARLRVVQNGISPLASPSADVRAELGISAEAPVIGAVTVLRKEKALDVLIESVALVTPEFPDLRMLLAGVGDEEDVAALRALVRARALEEVVLFLGLRSDVANVLAALDVAVSSSDREGSPLAIIEAMAAGKAIVATRVGGVPDLIRDGVEGILVERRDPPALANAIAALLRDPTLRAQLGERARERQRREFDIGSTIRQLEDLYEQFFLASERGRDEARLRRTPGRV